MEACMKWTKKSMIESRMTSDRSSTSYPLEVPVEEFLSENFYLNE